MKQQSAKLKKTKKKVNNLESKLKHAKLALAIVEQLKLDLATTVEARDSSYTDSTRPRMKLLLLWLKGTLLYKIWPSSRRWPVALCMSECSIGASIELATTMTDRWLSFALEFIRKVGLLV